MLAVPARESLRREVLRGVRGTPRAGVCQLRGQPFPPGQLRSGGRHPPGAAPAGPTAPRVSLPDTHTPDHLGRRHQASDGLLEGQRESKAVLEGERKQVTILFADLKASMELLADRDPEQARKLLDPVLERMMEAFLGYEGTVNQVMGDGIMALFGGPVAHEDHAVRAY